MPGLPGSFVSDGDRSVLCTFPHAFCQVGAVQMGVEESGDVAVSCSHGIYYLTVYDPGGFVSFPFQGKTSAASPHGYHNARACCRNASHLLPQLLLVCLVIGKENVIRVPDSFLSLRQIRVIRCVVGNGDPPLLQDRQERLGVSPQSGDCQVVRSDEIQILFR